MAGVDKSKLPGIESGLHKTSIYFLDTDDSAEYRYHLCHDLTLFNGGGLEISCVHWRDNVAATLNSPYILPPAIESLAMLA
mmetsp:Transcript_56912/g.68459  ORF Transcript_56912/g.68459 Transcript_56912/m.68459 type:complete len:81 (-) Transcript_56912:121-363(-)